ncbi:ATP-binding protein [Candidatus Villigracilis affinis]|uniref:ATP-binding protein n=1 Tax=Candidatus Villigracilis affinis TaxID=3140682 RepID=UPI001DE58924|nr:PAS domain-containing protein [Anaerolineales bacterium]
MKKHLRKTPNLAEKTSSLNAHGIVLATLFTGVIGSALMAVININRAEMMPLSVMLFITLLFGYFGYLNVARWLSLFTTLGVISSLVYKNNGIRDPAILGLVVVLIAAGLLAGRKGTIIVGTAILAEVILFGFLESQGYITNKFSQFNYFADYFSTSLCIVLVTVFQWLVIARLNENIKTAEQEIAERELVETQLRDAENRYRNLVEQIPAVVYISEPGAAGVWHYVSPQIEAMTGFTPEEWTGNQNLWYRLIHPEDREKTVEAESTALSEGHMPRTEYRLQTRSGAYIWVQDQSMRSMENNVLQGFLVDITARKIAEDQLQKRLAELNAVRGVSETLIAQTDLKELIQQTGDQIRITFGVDNLFISLLNTTTSQIHFPYYVEKGQELQAPSLTFGKGITSSVLLMKKPLLINENWNENSAEYGIIYYDNHPAKSSLTVPLMIGDKGIGAISVHDMEKENVFTENDLRLLSTIAANLAVAIENTRLQESLKRELTIQEKLVMELEQKNAELERFTYTASHDLKSPLITIRGYLGYLERDARSGNFDRLQQDVSRISEAAEKMHNLLNDLLELSRVGRIMSEPQTIQFEEIVKEGLRRVEGQLNQRQAKVQVGSEFPQILGDKERLIEVIQNLVDNACKFIGDQPNPTIEIGVEKRDGENIFFVKDNGVGIRKEFHDRVFGLFDKLDPDSSGTGIGLALVKRIIEVHGGRIWIDSHGYGSGTTFYFTLSEKPTL